MDVPVSPRILVTDDDDLVLNSLKDILEERYETTVTESPEQALEMLRLAPYNILLSDLMMDEMNGMDLIRAALRIRPGIIPIVIATEPGINNGHLPVKKSWKKVPISLGLNC